MKLPKYADPKAEGVVESVISKKQLPLLSEEDEKEEIKVDGGEEKDQN